MSGSLVLKNLIQDCRKLKKSFGFQYICNEEILTKALNKLNLPAKYPKPNSTKILEIYPGPAIQSLITYNILKPKQYILLEKHTYFHNLITKHILLNNEYTTSIKPTFTGLESIAKIYTSKDTKNYPNLQLTDLNPYNWESYSHITNFNVKTSKTEDPEHAIFLPSTQSFDKVHEEFLILGNLTGNVTATATGEALYMQLLSCITRQNWLQRFGRVRMVFWVSEATARKLVTFPGDKARSKASLLSETFTETKVVALSNSAQINPDVNKPCSASMFNKRVIDRDDPYFYDAKNMDLIEPINGAVLKKCGLPVLIEISPKYNTGEIWDTWDYVTKHLLVLKTRPLGESLNSLGPGAFEYFNRVIQDKSLLEKPSNTLTKEDFIYLTDIFYNWPFKPDIMMDFVDVLQDD
ncbi:related to Mitochondrial transcription factor 1 [Saccharomycodes ludwigii]|uniref:rRNA adenine N(6)-methyltransferase n=1 Tax=Saccharomycodes ludwigii TaxID=36035 RepID=A0A376B8P2_9ASCO|nr:hypothetical protein SCDLUD_005225 [Saccharomycodes ludwigii]KAH3898884.1 hypothetical protein SCDLUD_005225 [Saccharomycodes ludwigii]SSD60981.1 related to Mitochondrial transcription factor 1 [Saccharomycodes ludwigii]